MENKNFFIAILLSGAFLLFWSQFVMPRYAPHLPIQTPATGSPAASAPTPGITAPGATDLSPAHQGTSTAVAAEAILRDPQNEIVFSSKGGSVRHWRLMLKGKEIDIVPNPDADPLPLATYPETNFTIRQEANQITMQGSLPNRLKLTKILTLHADGFLHDLSFRLDNPTAQAVDVKDLQWGWGPGVGTAEAERKENSRLIRALSMGKLKAHVLKPGEYTDFGEWSGIDNRYFLIAFLPESEAHPTFSVAGTKDQTQVTVHETLTIPAHGTTVLHYQLYVGPKGYTQLGHYHKNLEAAVDFGTFSALGKIILKVIYWLKERTGNYGWAIIILTVMLQVLLIPLTMKSFKSMLAMKRVQPQLAALQKAYKSDPKRLNIEMMNLYKKSGTNPFGGCLPMLLQLPIFWALFTTLRNAYELRGAPFIFWLHDLSAPDPLHILPVAMGIAMFFQQRMSGATADPTQKQMMMLMPIMFTVMFFNFPAGLVLYWFTNNLLTMAIQYGMLRYHNKPLALEVVR